MGYGKEIVLPNCNDCSQNSDYSNLKRLLLQVTALSDGQVNLITLVDLSHIP